MSSNEYNDMFLKCQKNGPYHIFTFDIVDSKKMDKETRQKAQYKLLELAKLNYKIIEYIEKIRNIKILARPYENKKDYKIGFTSDYKIGFTSKDKEPIIMGDVTLFTIYRNTLSKKEVIEIFECCMEILEIDFEFHYADGYYETNDWREGNEKYYRGYCIDILSNLHKSYNKKLRKQLEKIKE